MSVRIIIPSRKREKVLRDSSLPLFPTATVCVAESEEASYRRLTDHIVTHPDSISGIGPLRQWILDNFHEDRLLQVDDDVYALIALTGNKIRRITDPATVLQLVENTAECAAGAGAKIWGFNQTWDIRKYKPQKPITLCGWVGGVIGVVGREAKWDTGLKLRADIDACLTSLLKHRITYTDLRFSFAQRRFEGAGGNALQRSSEGHEREIRHLQRKWGTYLSVRRSKTTVLLRVHVQRSRPMQLRADI